MDARAQIPMRTPDKVSQMISRQKNWKKVQCPVRNTFKQHRCGRGQQQNDGEVAPVHVDSV